MEKFSGIIIGIISALLLTIVIYFFQAYIRMYISKNKIKAVFKQIQGQVDIKHKLLKEYIEINKDSFNEEEYQEFINKLGLYKSCIQMDVDLLKDFNEYYNHHLNSFEDQLLKQQCEESEEKINHIREYYNELVCFFNRYKSNKINAFVSRIVALEDEKLY